MTRLLLLCALVLAAPLAAQPQGAPVIGDNALAAFNYVGNANGRLERVAVEGQEFAEAARLTTLALPAEADASVEWSMRIRARSVLSAARNDAVVATFWMRCVSSDSGECISRFNVERAASPYTKSTSGHILSGGAWRRFIVAFRMAEDYQAGQYNIEFWMGSQVQVVELGGISILNYREASFADIGVDTLYDGAAPDAPWRAAARERIEKYRKTGLTVVAKDEAGNLLPGAAVAARMKRHAFCFGSAVAADQLLGFGQDSDNYRAAILELFNCVVFENDLKWPQWERNRQRALDGLQWMRDNGLPRVRGHNLVWPGWQWLPGDLRGLTDDPEALRKRVLEHIKDAAGATRGLLAEWDVINEPFSNRDLQRILGDDEMIRWFQAAREADPDAVLYVNDYDIFENGGGNLLHRNHYLNTIRFYREKEAPLDAIGIQGHFSSATPPDVVLRILDRFAEFQLPVTITEFDFSAADEQLQAQYTRDFLTLLFSHPSVDGFLMWGFWEGRHWRPSAAMVRRDWSTKPNYDAYRDLVFKEWWTDASGVAGEDGSWSTQGFQGEYEIEAVFEGRSVRALATLGKENLVVEVVVPNPAAAGGGDVIRRRR